jgi:hypothetical protein
METSMRIQFKWYDARTGDTDDPKTGTPMTLTLESAIAFLRGKVVTGVGGASANTENFQIFFSDGTGVRFVTTRDRPRILFQNKP